MTLKSRALYPLVLTMLALVAYSTALFNDFVWLDSAEILQGKLIISHPSELFQSFLVDDSNYQGYHRPMYNIMHSLDYWIWGPNAFGFHLSSILLHIANGLLLYFLALCYTKKRALSFLIACLFVLLPCHTASVSLIHSKADLLACFFILVSLRCVQQSHQSGRNGLYMYAFASLCYVLALLSKELAIVLPIWIFVNWLVDPQRDSSMRNYLMGIGLMTLLFLIWRMSMSDSPYHQEFLSLGDRLLTFIPVYVNYFTHTLSNYELTTNDAVMVWDQMAILSSAAYVLAFVLILVAQFLLSKKHRIIAAGFLWYNLFLLPVMQVVPILHFRADRFLYVPSIGAIVALVFTGLYYYEKCSFKRSKSIVTVIVGAILMYFVIRISVRNLDFKSDETMFSKLIDQHPECREAQGFLGNVYLAKGDYNKSLDHLYLALADQSQYYSYVDYRANQGNLALVFMRQNRLEEALEIFENLYQSNTADLNALYNLSICHKKMRAYQAAIGGLEEYRGFRPNDPDALFNLGQIYMELGDDQSAQNSFGRYLEVYPESQYRIMIEKYLEQ